MKRIVVQISLVLLAANAVAAERIGPTYPITEPDMLKEIQGVLREKEKSGELTRLKKEAIARSKESVENPPPVQGLVRTQVARTYFFDPSYRLSQTLSGPNGEVIARAGDTINPLDYVSLSTHLLFFDGRDAAQVMRAKRLIAYYNGKVKPIMTAGAVLELTRKWKRQVYFDQGGTLVKKLNIRQVPALVSQEGRQLRIDELES
jgi:conjugal transfer pilus assembly protein TraW